MEKEQQVIITDFLFKLFSMMKDIEKLNSYSIPECEELRLHCKRMQYQVDGCVRKVDDALESLTCRTDAAISRMYNRVNKLEGLVQEILRLNKDK